MSVDTIFNAHSTSADMRETQTTLEPSHIVKEQITYENLAHPPPKKKENDCFYVPRDTSSKVKEDFRDWYEGRKDILPELDQKTSFEVWSPWMNTIGCGDYVIIRGLGKSFAIESILINDGGRDGYKIALRHREPTEDDGDVIKEEKPIENDTIANILDKARQVISKFGVNKGLFDHTWTTFHEAFLVELGLRDAPPGICKRVKDRLLSPFCKKSDKNE